MRLRRRVLLLGTSQLRRGHAAWIGVPDACSGHGRQPRRREDLAMTGQAHWVVIVPIVLGLVAIALLLWNAARAERKFFIEECRLLCPTFHRVVIATVVRSSPGGKILGVRRCSGLPHPELVTCGKECVAGLNQGTAGTASAKDASAS